jgi:hypothetical protein
VMTWLNSRFNDTGIIGSGTNRENKLANCLVLCYKYESWWHLHCRRYILSKALTAWGSSCVPRKSISDASNGYWK